MNQDIRDKLQAAGVTYWQLADALGIDPSTLTRWLRHPFSDERKAAALAAIDKIAATREVMS